MTYRNLSIDGIYNSCDEEIEETCKGKDLLRSVERNILWETFTIDSSNDSIEQSVENFYLLYSSRSK